MSHSVAALNCLALPWTQVAYGFLTVRMMWGARVGFYPGIPTWKEHLVEEQSSCLPVSCRSITTQPYRSPRVWSEPILRRTERLDMGPYCVKDTDRSASCRIMVESKLPERHLGGGRRVEPRYPRLLKPECFPLLPRGAWVPVGDR